MSRCRRMRTVSPALRARVTAWRTPRMSGPDSLKSAVRRMASSPSSSALRPGFAIDLGSLRTGAHDAGRPAVGLAQPQPGVDGLRPCPRVAYRVAAGQADADLDAVGDGGAAAVGEHHRLVAAGGEVTQRVVLAPQLEQPADGRLVLTGQRVVGALRLEQHDRRRDQGERAEQAEDRVEQDVRLAGEQVGIGEGESDHPVGHVRQAVLSAQAIRATSRPGPRTPGFRSRSPATSTAAALTSAALRTLAQNSR